LMEASDIRSQHMTVTFAAGDALRMPAATCSPRTVSRTAMTTSAPRAAMVRAVSMPRPEEAPVTMTTC